MTHVKRAGRKEEKGYVAEGETNNDASGEVKGWKMATKRGKRGLH